MNFEKIFAQAFAIDENVKKNISIMQDDDYFHLKLFKEARFDKIKNYFSRERRMKIYIADKYSHVVSERFKSLVDMNFLADNFFSDSNLLDVNEKIRQLEGSIIIFNSHMPQWSGQVSTLRNFIDIYFKTPNCIFVGWDWDNHHTVHISSIIAAGSDIYCHAHFNNDYEMASLNDRRFRVSATTFQWREEVILNQINYLMTNQRSNEPLGWHVRYGLFGYREKVIHTLSQTHKQIGLLEHGSSYFQRSELERLKDWGNHKAHWVVPTLNDLPCRVFDALITGGIPIMPMFLKNDPELSQLDEQDCEIYSANDIIDSNGVVTRAIEKFNQGGEVGIFRRINFVINNHTFSARLARMLKIIDDELDI